MIVNFFQQVKFLNQEPDYRWPIGEAPPSTWQIVNGTGWLCPVERQEFNNVLMYRHPVTKEEKLGMLVLFVDSVGTYAGAPDPCLWANGYVPYAWASSDVETQPGRLYLPVPST